MNKNSSLILNVVLLIAVAVLYYLHFSESKTALQTAATTKDSTAIAAKPVVMTPKEIKASKIVYVNSDVLNAKYDFVKDLTAAAQAKQQRLEATYQAKAQKLQQDYADYQQKASQGLLSEIQTTAAQADLSKRKDELDQMEAENQKMMDDIQKSNEEVRKTVVEYIKEYNKTGHYNYILTYTDAPGGVLILANDSLDITNEIIEGLNAQYRAKKGKK